MAQMLLLDLRFTAAAAAAAYLGRCSRRRRRRRGCCQTLLVRLGIYPGSSFCFCFWYQNAYFYQDFWPVQLLSVNYLRHLCHFWHCGHRQRTEAKIWSDWLTWSISIWSIVQQQQRHKKTRQIPNGHFSFNDWRSQDMQRRAMPCVMPCHSKRPLQSSLIYAGLFSQTDDAIVSESAV